MKTSGVQGWGGGGGAAGYLPEGVSTVQKLSSMSMGKGGGGGGRAGGGEGRTRLET